MAEPLLAADRVRFVGEPVAMVITDGRYQGEDAAELVSVDYEPLEAVIGPGDALADQTLLFPAAGTNLVAADGDLEGTGDALFDGCDAVAEAAIVNQRVAPVPIEVRGGGRDLGRRPGSPCGRARRTPRSPGRRWPAGWASIRPRSG